MTPLGSQVTSVRTFATDLSETVAVHQVTSVSSPINFRNSTRVGSPITFTVKVTSIETTSVAATTEPISNATNENLQVTMEILVPVNEDVSSPSFKKIEVGITNSYVRALEKQANRAEEAKCSRYEDMFAFPLELVGKEAIDE